MKRLLFLALLATTAGAQSIVATAKGIVVATDGTIELRGGWRVAGVRNPSFAVASQDDVAVIDSLANDAVSVELATGRVRRVKTGETPIGAVFIGRDLYILNRDSNTISAPGRNIPVDPGANLLRESRGKLYVYSPITGSLADIMSSRAIVVAPFASDLRVDGDRAWLVYPRSAKLVTVDAGTMRVLGERKTGAVPVSVELAQRSVALADPSSRRVWLLDRDESFSHAFLRGFFRGLTGLGGSSRSDSDFPTGVDRVVARGAVLVAYDSATGSLYRCDRRKSVRLAQSIAPHAFAIASDGRVWWLDAALALHNDGGDG